MSDEYGKQCQSCQEKILSRMYYRPCKGIKGEDKDVSKYRRLCKKCWAREEKHE